jgi:hypothetical protein
VTRQIQKALLNWRRIIIVRTALIKV